MSHAMCGGDRTVHETAAYRGFHWTAPTTPACPRHTATSSPVTVFHTCTLPSSPPARMRREGA
jgi:hypothetical protein